MMWRASSPLRASSTMVANSFEGGGTSRPLDRPSQTMISHASAKPTGSISPSAGRANRRRRPERAGVAIASALSSAGSSTVMAIARTLLAEDCKLADGTTRTIPGVVPANPDLPSLLPLWERGRISIRRQRNLIVDQRVERCLDVDLGVDHAGLLQRQPGGENGLALRRADPAVGQLGALLELF